MDIPSVVRQLALSAIPVLIAITFHEVAHGLIANKLGDPTARMLGRLTLNPLAHIDPIGTVLMPLMLIALGLPAFGYAKPVPINPTNFKNPKRDMAISAAGGPIMNVLLSLVSILILKFVVIPSASFLPPEVAEKILMPVGMMLKASVIINVVLASFNLIPIPPLDGGRILVGLLPYKQAMSFSRIEPFGFMIVILLMVTHVTDYFVVPLVNLFLSILGMF